MEAQATCVSVCSAALPPNGGSELLLDWRPVVTILAIWREIKQTVTYENLKTHSVHKNQKHCDTLTLSQIDGSVIPLVDCSF